MPKAEWGTKRMCAACGARFYDLGRSEVVCPACDAPYDLEHAGAVRRTRMGEKAVVEDEEVKPQTAPSDSDDEEVEDEAEIAATDEGTEEIDGDLQDAPPKETTTEDDDEEGEEDQSLIEDASELGDDDDVSDVIEGDIEKTEEER